MSVVIAHSLQFYDNRKYLYEFFSPEIGETLEYNFFFFQGLCRVALIKFQNNFSKLVCKVIYYYIIIYWAAQGTSL